jgi:hypothetical protein
MKEDARRIDDLMHIQVDPNFEAEIKEFVAQEIKEKMEDYIKTWNLLSFYFEKSNEMKQSPTVEEIQESLMKKKVQKNDFVTHRVDPLEQIMIEDLRESPEEELDDIKSLLHLYSDIIKRRGEMESQIIAATRVKSELKPEIEITTTKEADLAQTTKDLFHMHELFKEPDSTEPVSRSIRCRKCNRVIPDLPFCPYCGNKTKVDYTEPVETQETINIDEPLTKPKIIVNKIEEDDNTRARPETIDYTKKEPSKLRTISDIVTDVMLSIGLVALVSGIYILTRAQDPTGGPSDVVYQMVVSILDQLPGLPFSINLSKNNNLVALGFFTIFLGLSTLWVGYGLWKKIYVARVSGIVLYSFAIIADMINIMYYKLVYTPISVFVSIIELAVIGVLAISTFWN